MFGSAGIDLIVLAVSLAILVLMGCPCLGFIVWLVISSLLGGLFSPTLLPLFGGLLYLELGLIFGGSVFLADQPWAWLLQCCCLSLYTLGVWWQCCAQCCQLGSGWC